MFRVFCILALSTGLFAQVNISGRVVDETGAGISGARVELRPDADAPAVTASSDTAGNFKLQAPPAKQYSIRVERFGFYLYRGLLDLQNGSSELIVTLNHLQEFSDRVDVVSSPPAIDPKQPADRKELNNTEIQSVPYPAPQDYRNSLPLMDGVVQDNAGRVHFNGGDTHQTDYSLDGFNIADPVTGRLETRVEIDSLQSIQASGSRFSAENGRGSAGTLDLESKMGDDRFRFGGTNFIPSLTLEGGLHMNKWTPRLELSGPIARGRAWFHDGFDAFYSNDLVHGLPAGQNRTTGLTSSNLSRFQVNLRPGNILTGGFLYNLADQNRYGLSFLNPPETTLNHRQRLYMSTLRDQAYLAGGSLLTVGFADTRGVWDDIPAGDLPYEITPTGNRGNYFSNVQRHFYRQQWLGNLFLPTLHASGTHQLKFGIDFERESFHQENLRHTYMVLRDDNTISRQVSFFGAPYQERKNFEGAYYFQDSWTPAEGLVVEAGLRAEWNEVVRDLETAPRVALAWAPARLGGLKFSAGWGVYYDSISLGAIARHQDQVSLSTFYLPGGAIGDQVWTSFLVNDRSLVAPYSRILSFAVERKLFGGWYWKSSYTRRVGNHGLAFVPQGQDGQLNLLLENARRDRYNAFDVSVRHTFASKYEWFAGYTRSSATSSAAMDYSLENPVFGPQQPGPYAWDTPHRFHTWGWAPLPKLRWLTRNTTAGYLVEYRTGFPFSVVDEQSRLVGLPDSRRFPGYFDINLHFEREFRALHYLWAWRFGFNNLTNNGNPNVVNNVLGSPQFLSYGRGQARAFSVRLRLLGKK